MGSTRTRFALRPLAYVLVLAGLAVPTGDTASILLTRFRVGDGVRAAGEAAAAAIDELPTNRSTAALAHRAATAEAAGHDLTVRTRDFTIFPDGRVRLTGVRVAPTLLLGRFGVLDGVASVDETLTVRAPSL